MSNTIVAYSASIKFGLYSLRIIKHLMNHECLKLYHFRKYKRSSRQKYTPKRRLMNEYVDEVFESDDSGGSRTLRLPLATIPERNEAT